MGIILLTINRTPNIMPKDLPILCSKLPVINDAKINVKACVLYYKVNNVHCHFNII